ASSGLAGAARSGRADDVLRSDLVSARRHPGQSRPGQYGRVARVARAAARLPPDRIRLDLAAVDESPRRKRKARPSARSLALRPRRADQPPEDGIRNPARALATRTPARLGGVAAR